MAHVILWGQWLLHLNNLRNLVANILKKLFFVALDKILDCLAEQTQCLHLVRPFFEHIVEILVFCAPKSRVRALKNQRLTRFRFRVWFEEFNFCKGFWRLFLNELIPRQVLVEWDLQFRLLLGLVLLRVRYDCCKAEISQTCLKSAVHVFSGALAVNEKAMQLEIVEVVKASSHVPTPVEKVWVEDLRT